MLSSLDLTEEETESYSEQFTSILKFFEILKTAEFFEELVEEAIQLPEEGRSDECKQSSVELDHFSPYLEEGFFKVPKVIDPRN